MTYPTVVAVNGGHYDSDATSHTVNLPDGSNVAGKLILLFFTSDGSGESFTYPDASWIEIFAAGGSGFTNAVAYHVTNGTEGYGATGATITVVVTSVEQSAHTTYLISGQHASSMPVASTAATGTSTAPDSAALNPAGWDVEDTLWFTYCSLNGTSSSAPRISAYPTNYTDGRSDISPGGNGIVQATARRENATASEDPGAFTSDTSVAWRAATIGVRPAPAAAGPAKLKTFNGLETAKIKTINGLEIAKVKTINGLV
jgi:hypothetical protein